MFIYLFIVLFLNICLGYALAVMFAGVPGVSLMQLLPRNIRPLALVAAEAADHAEIDDGKQADDEARPAAPVPDDDVAEEEPADEIPEEWKEMLEELETTNSFVEASVQVLRLEVGRYRNQLVEIDERVRLCAESGDSDLLQGCLEQLKKANEDWLAKQAEAAGHLESRMSALSGFADIATELENVLMDQAAQIETTCSNIDVLDFESDIGGGCRRLSTEITKLLDLAHVLRDRMHESLLAIMQHEGRLNSVEKKNQLDPLTRLHNRMGLEIAFADWRRTKTNKTRLLSIVLLDIDDLSRINKKYGARLADQTLAAFGRLITELSQRDHGDDVIARFSGQQFVFYLTDTGPRNATGYAERIRQTIEQTTFERGEIAVEVTVSCGVSEVSYRDTAATVFDRAKAAIRQAKQVGGNQTLLDEGNGPKPVDPPQFEVQGRIVRIED